MEELAFGGCRIANIWYLHNIDLHHVATYYMYLKCVMLCEVQIVAAMARSWRGVYVWKGILF